MSGRKISPVPPARLFALPAIASHAFPTVPVRFPNLPDPVTGVKLPAGAKTVLWSFNHDTGRWEAQGTATITGDGNFAETDPGVGVRQPGWHGVAPGSPGGGPKRGPEVERIPGTADNKADTDGDGIRDGQEVFLGTNPLDGIGFPIGVVGAAPTPGRARDVAAANNLAVLACANGLAIFDVADPQNPVQLTVVPGAAIAVTMRGSIALAAFADSVQLIDLADPAAPVTRWSRTDLKSARAIEFGIRSAFAMVGVTLQRLNLESGVDTGSLTLPIQGSSVAIRGNIIYVLADGQLVICRDDDLLTLIGIVPAPGSGGAGGRRRHLFAAGDLLYAQHNFGFNVFEVSDPVAPLLLSDVNTTAAGWRDVVPTGTGLALAAVGPNTTDDGQHDVSLYNLQPGGTNAQFVATFETAGYAEAAAVAVGRGYVADGVAGLAVVNFLAPDLGTSPPSVALQLDSTATPPQVEGGLPPGLAQRRVMTWRCGMWISSSTENSLGATTVFRSSSVIACRPYHRQTKALPFACEPRTCRVMRAKLPT